MNGNLFPIENKSATELEPSFEKLTKREYFAALAFQSLIKNGVWIEFSQRLEERGTIADKTLAIAEENSTKIADLCLKYADAILARLEENT